MFPTGSFWFTEFTHVQKPNLFVDEQRFGPFRFWHHKHRFEEIKVGVEVVDILEYAMPYFVVGIFLEKLPIME